MIGLACQGLKRDRVRLSGEDKSLFAGPHGGEVGDDILGNLALLMLDI